MALREIRIEGDPILAKECKPIKEMTDRIRDLIGDMYETMYDEGGCGLAGPQVGILKQICVVDVSEEKDERLLFINPEIIFSEGEQTDNEGCLSVPGYCGTVTRAEKITVKALDENMEPFEMEAEGFLARAIQHEVDHLHGILYTSKVIGELMKNEEEEEDNEADE